MAATIKGVQPLRFGTIVTTGYITENINTDSTTQELPIENEGGDVVTQIFEFGNKDEISIDVIPKSATTRPALGDLFTYGVDPDDVSFNILGITVKQVKKDVEKWTLKGTIYPLVTPS